MLDKIGNNRGFDNFPTFDPLWINKDNMKKKKRKKLNGFQRQVRKTKRNIVRRIV